MSSKTEETGKSKANTTTNTTLNNANKNTTTDATTNANKNTTTDATAKNTMKNTSPPVFPLDDLTKNVDKIQFNLKPPHNVNGPILRSYGPVTYKDSPLRLRTPYMRTPRGLVSSEFDGKPEYYFELSLVPSDLFDTCLSSNAQNVQNIGDFVSSLEHSYFLHILENIEDFVPANENEIESDGDSNCAPNEEVLKRWQNSLIKESQDGYPPKFNFRMTNEIDKETGEYNGGVVIHQDFDFTDKKFVFEVNDNGKKVIKTTPNKSIKDIGKHFQVRFQLLAERRYFEYNKDAPSRSRFGIKWKVEQILYIESPGVQSKEIVFTSCNFDDIELDDAEPVNPKINFTVEGEKGESEHLSNAQQGTSKKQKL